MLITTNARGTGLVLALALTASRAVLSVDIAGAQQSLRSVDDTVILSLVQAQRLALQQNPDFLAERQAQDIARGELRQARIYSFNPEFELEASGNGGLTGQGSQLGLFQEVEWAGQRGLRIRAGEAGLVRAQQDVRNAARLTWAEVSLAFYGALVARRRLEVAEEVRQLMCQLMRAVRIQVAEGEISTLEANLAAIENGRAEARVLSARRAATTAELDLKRHVGLEPGQPIRLDPEVPAVPSPDSLILDALLRSALARRPDLAAGSAGVEQLQGLARLARREAIPNFRLGALGQRQDAGGETALRMAVGLAVPLWNRNQGVVNQREAEIRRSELRRQAIELRVRTEVTNAYNAYLAASEEEQLFEVNVLRPARANQLLLETAYREGKLDLPALLLLRNQLLEAELGYWEAWLARREALVGLEATTAASAMPDSGTTNER